MVYKEKHYLTFHLGVKVIQNANVKFLRPTINEKTHLQKKTLFDCDLSP